MFSKLKRRTAAFTLVEVLLTVSLFAMVFVTYTAYMSTQNKEVLTIIQKSEANDATNIMLQFISNDVKSAKRATAKISSDGHGISLDKFISQTDNKNSIQLALEKIEFKYDATARTLTRTASRYDQSTYDSSTDTFKAAPRQYESQTFKNVSEINFSAIPMPNISGVKNISSHMLGVNVKLVSETPNALTKTRQKSNKETSYFIRDEVNFKNEPFWNANPKYTKTGPLSLQFSDPLKINLSQLEFLNWINSLKNMTNVNLALSEISNKMMISLSREALEKLNSKYSDFMSDLKNNVLSKARDSFVEYIKKDVGNDPKKLTMAILIKNFIFQKNPADCQSLKEKIMSNSFSDEDIINFVKKSNEDLKKYGIATSQQISALTGASTQEVEAANQLIGNIRANIAACKGSLPDMVFKYVENTAANFAANIKKSLWDAVGGDNYINDKINGFVDGALDNVLGQIGVKEMVAGLDSGEYDPAAKAVITGAVNQLTSWLKSQIKSKVGDLAQTIKNTVKNNVSSALSGATSQAEALARQKTQTLSGDIAGSISDVYGSTMVTISKNLMLGNKWDEVNKQFTPGGGKDYLQSAFNDFGISLSSLSSDQQAAVKNDDQVRNVKEIMTDK